MMSEKTENRIATFVAVIIGLLMAVGINAQTIVTQAVQFQDINAFVNYCNQQGQVIFEQNVNIKGSVTNGTITNGVCVTFKKRLRARKSNLNITLDNGASFYFKKSESASLNKNGDKTTTIVLTQNQAPKLVFESTTGCGGVPLPVEAVEFYYQDRGNGTGSLKLVVTDEYDIEQYKIELTDQDNIDIGYKWWYASETQKGVYRVYEIPVTLPTDCADIDFIYAKVYKMESSTMEYEQILNTISILNQ